MAECLCADLSVSVVEGTDDALAVFDEVRKMFVRLRVNLSVLHRVLRSPNHCLNQLIEKVFLDIILFNSYKFRHNWLVLIQTDDVDSVFSVVVGFDL